jgi:hypothetical protein
MRRLLATVACLALLVTLLPTPALAAAPANDNWADAALITGTSGSVTATNAEATLETNELSVFGHAASVWYRWSPGRKDLVATFTTCGDATEFDTVLQVFTGTAGPPEWSDFVYVTGADDSCGLQSTVDFLGKAGETYWIRLAGYADYSYGAFTLSWTTSPVVRGTLSVTLTNTRGVPTDCTLVVKGVDLMAGQAFSVVAGSGQWASFTSLAGRWTPDPVYVPRSFWSVEAVGSLSLDYTVRSADGYSEVIPKFVNRCK